MIFLIYLSLPFHTHTQTDISRTVNIIVWYSCFRLPWWLSSKESTCNAGNTGSIPRSGRSPGEGKGNPLQYSCLGNPMDRGAWWVTVRRISQSQDLLTKPPPPPFLFYYIKHIHAYIYIHINYFSSLNFYTISEKFSHLAHLTLDLEHQPFFLILSKVPRASSMCHDSPSLWRRQSFLSISWEYFTPRYHQAALDFSFTFSNLVSNPERWYLAPLTNEAAVFPAFCSFSFVVLAKEIDWWSRWPEKSQLKVLLISFSEFRLSLCFSLILGAFQHLQIYFNWII